MRRVSLFLFLTLLLIGMLAFSSGISNAVVTIEQEEWVHYFPLPDDVSLHHWAEDGSSYIDISVYFPVQGINVSEWGTPVITGNNISVNAEIWGWTGITLPMEKIENNTYSLGNLSVGKYLFTFKVWGWEIKNITFIIADIVVPDDFPTIQEAINAANMGDTVYVKAGTYYEHVVVNKSLSLVGEDRDTTIIDGNETGFVVEIKVTDNVTISGFTIRRSGNQWVDSAVFFTYPESGIFLMDVNEGIISNNIIIDNFGGVTLLRSQTNVIKNNLIMNNEYGIVLSTVGTESIENVILENTIANNWCGLMYDVNHNWGYSHDNHIYHNNFINNSIQASSVLFTGSPNIWDAGYLTGGNYWNDYNGTDLYNGPYQNETGSDGIGDTPYVIDANNTDNYPLMNIYWSPADVDHDLDVDLYDAVKVLIAYGSELGDDNYNPHCDIAEPYGQIDLFDATLVLINYGRKYS